jgi:di/tricarboxylate transporter
MRPAKTPAPKTEIIQSRPLDLLGERLKIGDILLLIGFRSDIRDLQSKNEDIVVLNMPAELEEVLPAARRAPHALAVLGLVVALMISGLVPNVQAALIGCLLMRLWAASISIAPTAPSIGRASS